MHQAHHAFVRSDNLFQRKARLLQALWREQQGLPIGEHRGRPLGSRIAMPRAQERLENFLTPTIRDVVRREVLDPERSRGKLFGRPRIYNDLLSSQPLAFNLFGELQHDLDLATRVLRRRLPDRVERVTAVDFEHSPGRRDDRFTGDNSAFDVFVEYDTPTGAPGFIGIEVKYHEDLGVAPAEDRARYHQVARAMAAFKDDAYPALRARPLEQLWRDHLLAGSMLLADIGYADGLYVLLYPQDNPHCHRAAQRYGDCLHDDATYAPWTVEALLQDMGEAGAGPWVDVLRDRYAAFEKVEAALAGQ